MHHDNQNQFTGGLYINELTRIIFNEWTVINYQMVCTIVFYKIAHEYQLFIPCPIPEKPPVFLDKPA